jgi:hypothetical protein
MVTLSMNLLLQGRSDVTYASALSNHCSITGYLVFLNGAPIAQKSGQPKSVTLLSAEAELESGNQCARICSMQYRLWNRLDYTKANDTQN